MSTALDRLQLPDSPLAPKFAGILGSAMDDKVIVDLLGQVGNLFTSSLELKETIDFMLKAAADLVDCDAATVFLLDEDGRALSAIATYPFTDNLGRRSVASSFPSPMPQRTGASKRSDSRMRLDPAW
jgi:hypothetical protein